MLCKTFFCLQNNAVKFTVWTMHLYASQGHAQFCLQARLHAQITHCACKSTACGLPLPPCTHAPVQTVLNNDWIAPCGLLATAKTATSGMNAMHAWPTGRAGATAGWTKRKTFLPSACIKPITHKMPIKIFNWEILYADNGLRDSSVINMI